MRQTNSSETGNLKYLYWTLWVTAPGRFIEFRRPLNVGDGADIPHSSITYECEEYFCLLRLLPFMHCDRWLNLQTASSRRRIPTASAYIYHRRLLAGKVHKRKIRRHRFPSLRRQKSLIKPYPRSGYKALSTAIDVNGELRRNLRALWDSQNLCVRNVFNTRRMHFG